MCFHSTIVRNDLKFRVGRAVDLINQTSMTHHSTMAENEFRFRVRWPLCTAGERFPREMSRTLKELDMMDTKKNLFDKVSGNRSVIHVEC